MDTLRRLYIEPTSRCNLNCLMCFRRTWFDETPGHMMLDNFRRALDSAPDTVETIFFGGMGEPLFHPQIVEMVRLASQRVKDVQLLTNATLLTEKMSAALLDSGLTMLWISIDSFDPESYEEIRVNGRFDLVMKNMAAFNRLRGKLNAAAETVERRLSRSIRLGATFVVMRSNLKQLQRLPEFAAENHIDEVNVSNIYPSDPEAEKEALYIDAIHGRRGADTLKDFRPKITLPYMDWEKPDIWDNLKPVFLDMRHTVSIAEMPLVRRSEYCRFIEDGIAFVRSDGDVSPCMALLHNGTSSLCGQLRAIKHHSFGNVSAEPLSEIWESEPYRRFRDRVRRFDFAPCIHCGHCDMGLDNQEDCLGNEAPTCGGCLWSEGVIRCP